MLQIKFDSHNLINVIIQVTVCIFLIKQILSHIQKKRIYNILNWTSLSICEKVCVFRSITEWWSCRKHCNSRHMPWHTCSLWADGNFYSHHNCIWCECLLQTMVYINASWNYLRGTHTSSSCSVSLFFTSSLLLSCSVPGELGIILLWLKSLI